MSVWGTAAICAITFTAGIAPGLILGRVWERDFLAWMWRRRR